MPFIGSEEVPYHQQDKEDYCGAAVVQMMLAAFGADPLPDQSEFYQNPIYATGVQASTSGTSPIELCNALKRNPVSDRFCPQFDDKVTGCQRIAAALIKKASVPVIVQTVNHWNLVTGAQIDGDPATLPHRIKGFYVHEPEPVTASVKFPLDPQYQPPPPHKSFDCCGCGDYFGSANMYVTRYEWDNWYWKSPSTAFGQRGYISVVNCRQPLLARPEPVQAVVQPKPASDCATALDDAALKVIVKNGISDHGIDQDGPLARRISGYTFGDITNHCQRNTATRSRQISLMIGTHEVGRAAVDLDNREFLGVQAPPSVLITADNMMMFAVDALRCHAVEFTDLLEPSALNTDRVSINSSFVWQPSRQSMSRYNPFVQVKIAETVLYVGMDRRVHRELTPHK